MVTVRAPATSANLGSGFDVFGVALDRPADIVHVERADRTTIEVTGVGSQYIPTDPDRNVVGAVAEALDAPAHIRIDKGVRPSSGLGSSAASSAAAAVALNELYDRGLSREELVPVAAEGEAVVSGEAHADNVAPALLGGFTVATDEGVTTVDADIPLVACLPEIAVSTRDARRVVPSDASIEDMVHTVGRAATLAVGMCRRDADLVGAGMDDRVVTPRGRNSSTATTRSARPPWTRARPASPSPVPVPRSSASAKRPTAPASPGRCSKRSTKRTWPPAPTRRGSVAALKYSNSELYRENHSHTLFSPLSAPEPL